MNPMQQMLVVQQLQEKGNVVCFIGDQINNAAAIKISKISIAMNGECRCDVVKELSDIILMNDDYGSVLSCIEESILSTKNMQKVMKYILSSSLAKILPFLLSLVTNIPLPISAVLVFILALFETFLSISLLFEDKEDYDCGFFNNEIISWNVVKYSFFEIGILEFMCGMYSYFTVFNSEGYSPSYLMNLEENMEENQEIVFKAQTAYFVSIIFIQIINLMLCKTEIDSLFYKGLDSALMNYSILFSFPLLSFIIYVPFVNEIFSMRALRFVWFTPSVPYLILLFCLNEIKKSVCRRLT